MANKQRLIYADPVYEELRKSYEELKNIRETLTQHEDIQICNGQLVVFQEALMCIKNAPSVDAVEVIHGHWEYGKWEQGHWVKGNERCRCSVCHRDFAVDNQNIWHGCPQCLAKMDGDGDV